MLAIQKPLSIYILEDSEGDLELLVRFLKKQNLSFSYKWFQDGAAFQLAFKNGLPDLILADYALPQYSGIEAFRFVKNCGFNVPFIIVTGSLREEYILELVKEGIDDYIFKHSLLRLPTAILNVIYRKKIEEEKILVERLYKELDKATIKLKNAYKDIQDSINSACRIQEVILSDYSAFSRLNFASFLYLLPKDKLSGDFFWFKRLKDRILFGIADCTGHGVPAALLSILASSLLNEICDKFRNFNPAEILEKLHEEMNKALIKSNFSVHDGLEIGLCSINGNYKTLEFAGAFRPLYHLSDNQLNIIKPTRKSIGGDAGIHMSINNNIIPLKSKDRFYLFSDGYIDQFGGERNKKITSNRLQELLLMTGDEEFTKQQVLISDFFIKWKGQRNQTDDTTIFGLEIP